ncbi:MAG: glycosyltransferase [Candidatus Omnitrophica bacterium]|nr:glycosyltransferase [Candidatus Omnitrophota bacterium]
MKLALIFDKTRPDTIGGYFERATRALGLSADHWWLRDAGRMPAAYDLYLRIDHGDDYDVALPEHLRPAVFYAIDTHLPHSWRKIRRAAPRYDLVFCCHEEGAGRLPGAEWLPVACDPELHGRLDVEPAWDVAFVGTDGGVPRKFYLQALRERYPNSFLGMAGHTQLAAIYSRARIGFNYSIADDVNMRVFEVLAAGTLLLTNALRGDPFRRLGLEDRKHLALYRSPEELFRLLDEWLGRAEERQRVARAGREVALARHTYAHRLRRILAVSADRLGLDASRTAPEGRPAMEAPR